MLYERLEFRRKRLKLLAKWQSIFYVVPVMPVCMEKADFFKNPAFKGLTEKQISSALETAATPIFEVGDRVYWLGPSEIEDIKLTDV